MYSSKFCVSPNFLSQPKNLTAFSAFSKTFVSAQRLIRLILLNAKKIVWHKMHQYANQFLVWHKKFGPAQNILGTVEGQGISVRRLHQNRNGQHIVAQTSLD